MSLRLALRPLAACSALFLFGTLATAQTKVAVISLQKAVLESAEIKAASAAMEARYKPRVTQIETLDRDIAQLTQNLQTNAGKLTPQAEADTRRSRPPTLRLRTMRHQDQSRDPAGDRRPDCAPRSRRRA